ncbi:MAG: phospholipase D family protein [Desulfuromonadaceae bacterium]|nr:phospholipase D family protein [Desulfuromonadaceae bacterium]
MIRLSFIFLFALTTTAWSAPLPSTGTVAVYFSPRGGATEAIISEISKAKHTIQLQAYSFTSAPIAKALLEAHKRGVHVEAMLDKSQKTAKYTSATFLVNAGIPVLIDSKHAIAHNKIIIIDQSTLITGSFNFTKAAEEKNAENLLVIKGNQPLVDKYMRNFEEHKFHSWSY